MGKSGLCIKCGAFRQSLHRDHIKPRALDGNDKPSNIQYLCANCHEDKSRIDMSSIMKKVRANSKTKKSWNAATKAALARPDVRAKRSAAIRASWTFERKAKQSAAAKITWTPAARKRMGIAAKRGWVKRKAGAHGRY